jgi:phage major head subunit gpT-like protein
MPIVPTMMSEQWPRFVLPIVRREWLQQMTAVVSPVASLFGVETSTSSVEYSQGIGGGGLVPEYNSDTDPGNAQIQYDSFNPLYETTFTHKEYAKGLQIERKLWDDDRAGLIRRKASALGLEYGQTRATHAASILNNAFSSSYLGADGKALSATDHPTSPNDSTSISNKGTTAFSYAAVKATLQAGRRMDNDRGLPMPIFYNTLIVPVELEETAVEILQALAKPGTADNDANAVGNIRVIADPYLTDANNWFMVDSAQAKLHMLWFDRVTPELSLDPTSDFNLVARYRGYMRYSFGWDDFRFIYGHEVT